MLFLFAFQAEDLLDRATRGAMDLGRMFSAWWTMITALMLLSWFCLRITTSH